MIRKIITYPDPVLRKISEPVEVIDGEIRLLLDDMIETMYAGGGVGLAAPQVAVSRRIIIVDVGDETGEKPNLLKLINPDIVFEEGEIEYEEGCLSVPEFRFNVRRSQKIIVEYQDETGKNLKLECEGILAIVIQHEVDHLDGKLIIDSASRLKREIYERKVKKLQGS